jgi:tRNA threonylcarbamoyladenosine biosynthesis protein TsaE
MTSQISHSLEETKKIAGEWLAEILVASQDSKSDTDLSLDSSVIPNRGATIIGLSGNLGSGKTTFTQFIAQELGITEFVTSPTFVIMKIYQTKHKYFKKLIHIDAYRFEKPEELEVLNLEKFVNDPQNLILIEWPEKVVQALPKGIKIIRFEVVGESERKISFI